MFSDSIFYLFYRDRTEPTYKEIFHRQGHGQSRRSLARDLKCSLDTVQRRFQELARQGLLLQAHKAKDVTVRESVAYDGLENFSASQFEPNNINHVVGRESYFLYDFNFSPLNRKGRMSPGQRQQDQELAKMHGRFPRNTIQLASYSILKRMLARSEGELIFHSDNHYAYRAAIELLPRGTKIEHVITSAKKARNYRNKLFAINHLDRLTRQQLPTFTRETIAFAKHSIGMIESFTLLMVWKNFMRTIFIKKSKEDPRRHLDSPAMRVGIAEKVLKFHEFYKMRIMLSQVNLSDDWMKFVARSDPTSRRRIAFNH